MAFFFMFDILNLLPIWRRLSMSTEQERLRNSAETHDRETKEVIKLIDGLIQSDSRMQDTKEFTIDIPHFHQNEASYRAAATQITFDKSKAYEVNYKRGEYFITVKPSGELKPSSEIALELNELIAKINDMDDIKEYTHGKTRIIKDIDDNHIFTITIE